MPRTLLVCFSFEELEDCMPSFGWSHCFPCHSGDIGERVGNNSGQKGNGMLAEGYSKSLPHEMLSFRFGFTELKSFIL